ncbi:glycoside hydrolase family 127 protein [Cohnella endophytica]|uniref:Glycoside hydrolase family 127 protein n=1 Tax=Cohnella endophytica TaxID=2419778 RepID=A0A494XR09_9BACL|nr:beta-L-arabinofuranosidase domain-containing protein [Cohnella endophytica]RKP53055.1 glycoside hydrolase family 127 protein [Cohnella endophytica]
MSNLSISTPVQLKNVTIQDDFWSPYISLVRDVVVPYQWEALNDRIEGTEPSHAIRNFRIAAGLEQGDFYGMVFQDSDVAKWLEAVGYLLERKADPELEKIADEVVDLIAKAQHADGYLNTYFTLKEPSGRWTNLAECHELYCAGHLIEAAVAYEKATGKGKILEVACKLADCIDAAFGPEEGKIKGYDGHQEIELALMKLYRATSNDQYMKLAKFFLDQRGQTPHFYDLEYDRRNGDTHFKSLRMAKDKSYSQAHLPIRLQETAEGHAVRVVYMCAGMADVAAATGDEELLQACLSLWKNIVNKRMYITGAIGSMAYGESFTLDYDLPSDTAYAETCASIGLIFFAQRMLQIEPRSEYADVLERALYNTVIGGMSRDGQHFFYVNPLEVWPEASGKNQSFDHVKMERQRWFGCACCPPNIARLLASLGSYIYSVQGQTLYAHLYIGSQITVDLDGSAVQFVQHSELPWEGNVRFELTMDRPKSFALALRIPGWCTASDVRVNGQPVPEAAKRILNGYLHLEREWSSGDIVHLILPMNVNPMKGNPDIRETVGMVAIQRGPMVYCLEEADNGKGLHKLLLHPGGGDRVRFDPDLMGGMLTIELPAYRIQEEGWADQLYRANAEDRLEATTATFIPYFAWANRGIGEMRVWVRENTALPF